MAEATTQTRERIEQYGITASVGVAVLAGVVYYVVHELFHVLFGVGPVVDTVGSVALGAVAAIGVYALGWNLRAALAAFVGLFATHSLVMGRGGVLVLGDLGWSVPVAAVAAVVFFLAAGGLER